MHFGFEITLKGGRSELRGVRTVMVSPKVTKREWGRNKLGKEGWILNWWQWRWGFVGVKVDLSIGYYFWRKLSAVAS